MKYEASLLLPDAIANRNTNENCKSNMWDGVSFLNVVEFRIYRVVRNFTACL